VCALPGDDAPTTDEATALLERSRQMVSRASAPILEVDNPPHRPVLVWLNPMGRVAVTVGVDGSLRSWDTAAGRCLQAFPGPGGRVNALDGTAGQRRWGTAGDDGAARIWDAQSGACIGVLGGAAGPLTSIALSDSGRLVAVGAQDGRILVWEVRQGSLKHTLRAHRFHVLALAAAGESTLFSGGRDRVLRHWDLQTGALLREFRGHQADVSAVAMAPFLQRNYQCRPVGATRKKYSGRPRVLSNRTMCSAHTVSYRCSPIFTGAGSP